MPFVIVIFVVLIALFDVLLRRSVIFRRVYYTGSNEKAARLSGIDTKRMKVMCATICSTLAGIAGVIYMARFGEATPQFGVGMELSVIAAAVLGSALRSMVTSSLILLNVPVYWQDIIRGAILLVAVTADHILNARKARS